MSSRFNTPLFSMSLATLPLLEDLLRPAMFSTIPAPSSGSRVPQYNVRVEKDDKRAVYEVALPGYEKSDVQVRYSKNRLSVSSSVSDDNASDYIIRSFRRAPFHISWAVSEAKVASATMSKGVLKIVMEKDVETPDDLVAID